MQKQIGELHGFLLRQRLTEDLQRLTEMQQCHSCPHFFFVLENIVIFIKRVFIYINM